VTVVDIFTEQLKNYAGHFLRLRHQYRAIRQLRDSLMENEVMLHIDFSDNYCEKYGEEVQGTLRQGVMYRKVCKKNLLCHKI
jgi:hypothetical protein